MSNDCPECNTHAGGLGGYLLVRKRLRRPASAGTVIPAKDSVYVAAGSINGFKNRGSGPSGSNGLFIVGPLTGTPDGTTSISISSA